MNKMGPKMVPCGIPLNTLAQSEKNHSVSLFVFYHVCSCSVIMLWTLFMPRVVRQCTAVVVFVCLLQIR